MSFTRDRETLLRELRSDEKRGLSTKEAERRLLEEGKNQLDKAKKAGLILRFFWQMKDPMILVLLGAAALSYFASGGEDVLDMAIILLIVVVNACISISQEDNAQKSLAALEDLSAPRARVLREGHLVSVDAADLVVGDVISLRAGDYVPADGRILSSNGLETDESAMTGESMPVAKDERVVLGADTPLGDRKNMVISATVVTKGQAVVLVTATGMRTEMGKIAHMLLKEERGETPLQQKIGEISKTLSFVCLAICGILLGVGLLQQRPMLEMMMTALSLAVAAIPEGLPAIVTIVLAVGVERLARQRAVIKKLPAVETLGAASVICSDKTGTLTQNKMSIVELYPSEPLMRKEILTLGSLCSSVEVEEKGKEIVFQGEPTEKAFVELAYKEGIKKRDLDAQMKRQGEKAFDSTRKCMSTLHKLPEKGYFVAVKGAPEVILASCTSVKLGERVVPLKGEERERILSRSNSMAGRALRVLAVALRPFDERPSLSQWEENLTFVGLVGMIDPPRKEVRGAVSLCHKAGIKPVMITGDHKATALAIAKDLDIFREGDLAMTGEDLELLPQEILEEDIHRFSVFARVSPAHKMRIVKAWQKRGKVVAMTGDGVNDAPALKVADIGCAMGKSGTDVAKQTADMILTDDNFATVVEAVEEGRGVYANIKKSIQYLLSCNIGEMLTIMVATILAFPQMPLSPVQLLWLNLVTDSLPALALGMEAVEEGSMEKPPRDSKESFFSRDFSFGLLWQGAMVGGLTLLAYFLGFVYLGGTAMANTMAFATLTLSQLFHAFDVRSEEHSLFHIGVLSNPSMNKAFALGMVLELGVLCVPPISAVFGVVAMGLAQWLTVLGLALVPLFVCEVVKFSRKRGKKEKKALAVEKRTRHMAGKD